MPSLDDILAATRLRVTESRSQADLRRLESMAAEHTPRGFRRRLVAMSQIGPAVIAELKKASPSKGLLRPSFDVDPLARQLAQGGASALSVLTDQEFFQGSLGNLVKASAAVDLPCLRKDFILDEFQVLEARAYHADAILLILAALDDAAFQALLKRARELQLDVLCEVHDEVELKRALDGGADIIGVNSRDLRTFHVSIDALFDLAPRIPGNVLRVAESGIDSGSEIRDLHASGYQAFLIGEALMRAGQPDEHLRRLLHDAGDYPSYPSASANWRGSVQ